MMQPATRENFFSHSFCARILKTAPLSLVLTALVVTGLVFMGRVVTTPVYAHDDSPTELRRFIDERVIPVIDKHFEEATFPSEVIPEMAEMGLFGGNLPE